MYIVQHEYLNTFISPCAKLMLEANKEKNLFEFNYVRSSTKIPSFSKYSASAVAFSVRTELNRNAIWLRSTK